MSLLNEMLKNLDKRTHQYQTVVTPVAQKSLSPIIIRSIIWGLILILTAVLLISMLKLKTVNIVTPKKSEARAKPSSAPVADRPLGFARGSDRSNATMSKSTKLMNFSREDWYEEHLNQALTAIQTGSDQRAIDLLSLILTEFPTSIEARENLSILYLTHNNLELAYEVLNDGLNREPNNLRLIIVKARLLAEQGSNHAALKLLEQYSPNINMAPDYYALLAALFESLGRVNEAGSVYQELTKLDPNNGQYWLGLAIALEHKHANHQAIEAYKRASESDDVRQSVRAYAENRLAILQG